jgi:pimeloyl-ACP methyl ester carboxylesterase
MPFVEHVTAPTLIATGEFDPNLASSRRALAGFADARLEVLPLTAHGSVMQRPDLVTATVSAFLKD